MVSTEAVPVSTSQRDGEPAMRKLLRWLLAPVEPDALAREDEGPGGDRA